MSQKQAALTRARAARRQITPEIAVRFVLVCLALLAIFPSLPVPEIGSPTAFGGWVLGFVSLSLAAQLLFALLKRYFGWIAAGIASAGLLANFVFVHTSGNLFEAYALLLQVAALLLLANMLTRPGSVWRSLGFGILFGLLVTFKLDWLETVLVSLLFLCIAAATARSWRRLADLLRAGAGFLGVWAFWGLYFLWQHAFPGFFSQGLQSFAFPAATNLERIAALQTILKSLYQSSGFFSISMLAWLVVIPFLYFNESRFRETITSRGMGGVFLLAGILLAGNGIFDDQAGRLYALSALSAYRIGLIASGLALAGLSIVFLGGFSRRWSGRFLAAVPPGRFSGAFIPLAYALVDLPVQLGFASLFGQADGISVVSVLPSAAILIAFVFWSVLNHSDRYPRSLAYTWLVILSLPILFTGLWATITSQPIPSTLNVSGVAVIVLWMSKPAEQPLDRNTGSNA